MSAEIRYAHGQRRNGDNMEEQLLYCGGSQIVEFPRISKARYTRDFSWGFYATDDYEEAYRQAYRMKRMGFINKYRYREDENLKILRFEKPMEEWINFIGGCRNGYIHDYDIVIGPMVDGTIWDYVNEYFAGRIDFDKLSRHVETEEPSWQISFHTLQALECLRYEGSEVVHG